MIFSGNNYQQSNSLPENPLPNHPLISISFFLAGKNHINNKNFSLKMPVEYFEPAKCITSVNDTEWKFKINNTEIEEFLVEVEPLQSVHFISHHDCPITLKIELNNGTTYERRLNVNELTTFNLRKKRGENEISFQFFSLPKQQPIQMKNFKICLTPN